MAPWQARTRTCQGISTVSRRFALAKSACLLCFPIVSFMDVLSPFIAVPSQRSNTKERHEHFRMDSSYNLILRHVKVFLQQKGTKAFIELLCV